MSTNSDRSKQATLARLLREAAVAEAAGRLSEATAVLQEVAELDPRDQRTLHRLGDIHRTRLNRPDRAASWYAREAHCLEHEGFAARAIAAWRLVVRCVPARLEAYERIGALYASLGRVADARLHYETSARELQAQGFAQEAAILRAQLAAMEPVEDAAPAPRGEAAPAPGAGPAAEAAAAASSVPDSDALGLAAEREQDARVYYHHGLHSLARRQLEDLLALLPGHVGARQLLVDVCRALGDQEAAAEHLRVLTDLLRRESGAAAVTAADEPCELPPFEEWGDPAEAPDPASPEDLDVAAGLMDAVRGELERFVGGLPRPASSRGEREK
jgi:tetratricopeptide (TPR) repeat protein